MSYQSRKTEGDAEQDVFGYLNDARMAPKVAECRGRGRPALTLRGPQATSLGGTGRSAVRLAKRRQDLEEAQMLLPILALEY